MAKNVQLKDPVTKVPAYPITVADNVYLANGDNLVNNLDNKINKTECVRYVTSKWISSDGLSWYTIYSDGWKEQGGVGTHPSVPSNKETFTTLYLNVSFSNTNYTFLTTMLTDAGSTVFLRNFKNPKYTSYVRVGWYSYNTTISGTGQFMWYACGY